MPRAKKIPTAAELGLLDNRLAKELCEIYANYLNDKANGNVAESMRKIGLSNTLLLKMLAYNYGQADTPPYLEISRADRLLDVCCNCHLEIVPNTKKKTERINGKR